MASRLTPTMGEWFRPVSTIPVLGTGDLCVTLVRVVPGCLVYLKVNRHRNRSTEDTLHDGTGSGSEKKKTTRTGTTQKEVTYG